MRLSEAIRLGSMLKPQAFGEDRGVLKRWFRRSVETSCAVSAALDAIGNPASLVPAKSNHYQLRGLQTVALGEPLLVADTPVEWNTIFGLHAICPACTTHSESVAALIQRLNDEHRWTREQIADWVETIEQQQEAQLQPVAESVTVPS